MLVLTPMQPSPWRRRFFWLFVLAAMVALLLWLRPRRRPEILEVRSETRALDTTVALAAPRPAPSVPDALREPEADPPIIDEVSVEKSEVCEGEENLVTVRAHTKDPRDNGYLRYVIAGTLGSQVPVAGYFWPPNAPPRMIQVIGRNGASTTVDLPNFQVRNCRAAQVMSITMRILPNSADEYELAAQVLNADPRDRFVPVQFDWDFGDKTSERTKQSSVEHRFEHDDAQDSLYSRFLVRVEATDAKGRKLVGRYQANIQNSEFENLKYKGTLVLSYQMTPRFPQLNEAGIVEQKIRVWHRQPYPVKLRRAVVTAQSRKGGKAEGALGERVVDPADVLGTATVPSTGIEATVRFDAKSNDQVSMIDYMMTGEMADGTPAVLRFSVMRPQEMPSRDSAIAVTDGLLNAKIQKARELLNRPFVNDDDLRALERDGAFDGLKADPDFKPGDFGWPEDIAKKGSK